jgi:hypothetical protein
MPLTDPMYTNSLEDNKQRDLLLSSEEAIACPVELRKNKNLVLNDSQNSETMVISATINCKRNADPSAFAKWEQVKTPRGQNDIGRPGSLDEMNVEQLGRCKEVQKNPRRIRSNIIPLQSSQSFLGQHDSSNVSHMESLRLKVDKGQNENAVESDRACSYRP